MTELYIFRTSLAVLNSLDSPDFLSSSRHSSFNSMWLISGLHFQPIVRALNRFLISSFIQLGLEAPLLHFGYCHVIPNSHDHISDSSSGPETNGSSLLLVVHLAAKLVHNTWVWKIVLTPMARTWARMDFFSFFVSSKFGTNSHSSFFMPGLEPPFLALLGKTKTLLMLLQATSLQIS